MYCVNFLLQERKSRKEQFKLQKKLTEKLNKITRRQPHLDVMQEQRVKAAYDESVKRKHEAEESQSRKRAKTEEVRENNATFRKICALF